jgi:hypothetical protein
MMRRTGDVSMDGAAESSVAFYSGILRMFLWMLLWERDAGCLGLCCELGAARCGPVRSRRSARAT